MINELVRRLQDTNDRIDSLERNVDKGTLEPVNSFAGAPDSIAAPTGMWVCGQLAVTGLTGAIMEFDPDTLEANTSALAFTPGNANQPRGVTGGRVRFCSVDVTTHGLYVYSAITGNVQRALSLNGGIPGVNVKQGAITGTGGNDEVLLLCGEPDDGTTRRRAIWVIDIDDSEPSGFKLRDIFDISDRIVKNRPTVIEGAAVDLEGNRLFACYGNGEITRSSLSNPTIGTSGFWHTTNSNGSIKQSTLSGIAYRDNVLYVANRNAGNVTDPENAQTIERYDANRSQAGSTIPMIGKSHIAPFFLIMGLGG